MVCVLPDSLTRVWWLATNDFLVYTGLCLRQKTRSPFDEQFMRFTTGKFQVWVNNIYLKVVYRNNVAHRAFVGHAQFCAMPYVQDGMG